MAKGSGRTPRIEQLEALTAKAPAVLEAMRELRKYAPQEYRKNLRRVAAAKNKRSALANLKRRLGLSERKRAKK